MPETVKGTAAMIAGMAPELRPGVFVFASGGAAGALLPEALAMVREAEGVSLILPVEAAARAGLSTEQPMRCITLSVYSALDGVGLTAAVAGALAADGIPCNMVAGFHHDHVFVPEARAARAMEVLHALQEGGGGALPA